MLALLSALPLVLAVPRPAMTSPVPTTSAVAVPAPVSEDAVLHTATGDIFGTLLIPDGAGPHPVALIIAGSGPTDRDGNTPLLPGANNSLKLLAEALAAHGIASLRYDKRGIGASKAAAPPESQMRIESYADDAAAWMLQLHQDRRFNGVAVVGHSEGSLIGMLALEEPGTNGFAFVSLEGAGRPLADVIHEQLAARAPQFLDVSDRILAKLKAGETTDSVPPELAALFRPSVQPYLISMFAHDPAAEIARLHIPVLIVQGTNDSQVTMADAQRLLSSDPRAQKLVVDGMTHVLKLAGADQASQMRTYSDPSLPLPPELVQGITAFLANAAARH